MIFLKIYFFLLIFLHILTLGFVLARGKQDDILIKLFSIMFAAPLLYMAYKFLF